MEMKQLDRLIRNGHELVPYLGAVPWTVFLKSLRTSDLFYPGTLVISNNGSLIYDAIRRLLSWKNGPFPLPPASLGNPEELGIHIQTTDQ